MATGYYLCAAANAIADCRAAQPKEQAKPQKQTQHVSVTVISHSVSASHHCPCALLSTNPHPGASCSLKM